MHQNSSLLEQVNSLSSENAGLRGRLLNESREVTIRDQAVQRLQRSRLADRRAHDYLLLRQTLLHNLLRNEHRRFCRLKERKLNSEEIISQLQEKLAVQDTVLDAVDQLRLEVAERARLDAAQSTHALSEARSTIIDLRDRIQRKDQQLKALRMKVLRCGDRRATSRVTAPVWILWKNGHYTYTSRRLIRSMTDAGCAQNRVGPLMRDFAHAAKILIQGRVPSRRTVGRVLIEGGVMAKIQLAFEIRNSPSNTISSDGTSDHGLEYLIHFIVVYAPESYSHPGAPLHHLNRMAGFGSILNKSSDTQLSAWKRLLSRFVNPG